MYVENTIYDFIRSVKSTLTEFHYLPMDFYSPNRDFDERLKRYVVENDVALNLKDIKWIGFVWTFTPVVVPEVMGKATYYTAKDTANLTGSKYLGIFKNISFRLGAFSNSMYECIKFMEMFSIKFDRSQMVDILFPEPFATAVGNVPTQLFEIAEESCRLIGREEKGSLSVFEFGFNCNVPIFRLESTEKLIGGTPDLSNPGNFFAKVNLNLNIPDSFLNINHGFVII